MSIAYCFDLSTRGSSYKSFYKLISIILLFTGIVYCHQSYCIEVSFTCVFICGCVGFLVYGIHAITYTLYILYIVDLYLRVELESTIYVYWKYIPTSRGVSLELSIMNTDVFILQTSGGFRSRLRVSTILLYLHFILWA